MLETDYLVIGAGALGMTFADQILSETDASLILVDRRHAPGGHWVDAYPFVRLHQPSAYYGAGSRDLGSNRIDAAGFNKGYYELASGPEIQAYFDSLMRSRFLPSGRVQYFPLCDYQGERVFRALLTGETREVKVRKRIVDATRFTTRIPATHPPAYAMEDGVEVIPPNSLPARAPAFRQFTIVGGGKTGMDVAVWLLGNGVDPGRIRWIVSRDSWLINRETIQPGDSFYEGFLNSMALQLESCVEAKSVSHLFQLLEDRKQLLRIDRSVRPTMYHSATISIAECELLGQIQDVVRMGYVKRIGKTAIELDGGSLKTAPDTLYIDCSATGLTFMPAIPVFAPSAITIQTVRAGLFSLSAAVIAHVEAAYDNDEEKNRLCTPLALPNSDTDWIPLKLQDLMAQQRWARDSSLRDWFSRHRLTGGNLRNPSARTGPQIDAIKQRIKASSEDAMASLQRLQALVAD